MLFLIFINDLFGEFEGSSIVSGYADDLAVAVQDRRKEDATRRMQGRWTRW